MHDYDVEAVALATPPPVAVMTPYRPAVSVRNNGNHDALASGYVRIYSADLLIFETEVYSANITPGATGLAQAIDYWTPPAEGKYMIFGYVTCPLDQYEPNNNLAPTTITVTGLPPPEQTPVPLHAAQHEEGGRDEVSIDGLKGLTADQQEPRPHVANHQAGGDDELNLGGLLGEAAQDQPTKVHSNSKHDPQMATASALSQHEGATTVHSAATNLANRETTGPDSGLVKATQLVSGSIATPLTPAPLTLRFDRRWGPARHETIGINALPLIIQPNIPEVSMLELPVPVDWQSDDMQFLLQSNCILPVTAHTGQRLHLRLYFGAAHMLAWVPFDLNFTGDRFLIIQGTVNGTPTKRVTGALWLMAIEPSTGVTQFLAYVDTILPEYTNAEHLLYISADLVNADLNTVLEQNSGFIRSLHPIP